MKYGVEARYDLFDPVTIVPFRSWGTTRSLRVQGRVLERPGLNQPDEASSLFENAANTARRVESDEIPGARIEVAYRGTHRTVTADREGFFRVDIAAELPLDGGWHRVGLRIVESMAGAGPTATAEVCVPDPDADFIVVSDIDDTAIVTHVNARLDMLRRVVAGNARTRRAVPGVPAFYRALGRGSSPHGNPLFYVSRSGWNFYDLLVQVLDRHGIPAGPMLMRDLALIESRAETLGKEAQKLAKITEVIEAFPDHRFILIGDSGQSDPSIYAECASRYGSRVAAVYIHLASGREVAPDAAERIRSSGAALCSASTVLEMARHAAAHGFIREDEVAGVAEEEREA